MPPKTGDLACANKLVTGAYVAQEIGRDKQTMANLLAMLLKSGSCDVDRVAEISDLATRVSAFADHHWAGMQPCTEERDRAELLPIRVRLLRDPVSEAIQAAPPRHLRVERPRHDHLVPTYA
jgi:hypothetical protein